MPHAPAARAGAAVCSLQRRRRAVGAMADRLLDGVNLELRAGEIVAIAGVAGNGQQALADLLFGLHALSSGHAGAAGPRDAGAAAADWVRAGVARIPEDRHAVGVVGDLPVWENAVLERYAIAAFARAGIVSARAAQAHARQLVERFDVRGTEARGWTRRPARCRAATCRS